MKSGDVEWHVLSDGTFRLDGGAMFGVVPKPLWEKKARPDDRNRILLGLHPLLIKAGGKTILVDTGAGRKESGRFAEVFAIGNETNLVRSLAALDVAPEDVDIVVYTHLHFDHAGGGTRLDEEGKPTPVFPRAVHLVQADELHDAQHPTDRSRASYFPENWKPVEEAGLLNVVDGGVELAPGVRTVVMKGHVRSLSAVSIESGSEKLFYPTDNMPTSAHVPGPWIMGYDLYPLDTLAWKERFLEQAADEGWTVIFEHDPEFLAGKIHRDRGRFDIEEIQVLSNRTAHAG